jgi:hypothetical protein
VVEKIQRSRCGKRYVEGGKMWMRRCGMRRCAGADVGENVEDERGMRRGRKGYMGCCPLYKSA